MMATSAFHELRTGLSHSVSTLFIILSLRSLLSVVKIEKFSKDGVWLQHQSYSWIAISNLHLSS